MTTSKRIGKLLISPATGLQTVLEKAAILQQLTLSLRQLLPEPLNQHLSVANIRNHTLVIAADSSAWLTRARFHASAILKLIRQETGLKKLTKVHFKVISTQPEHGDFISHQTPTMSETTSMLLDSTANRVKDKSLKAALHRLSRNRS